MTDTRDGDQVATIVLPNLLARLRDGKAIDAPNVRITAVAVQELIDAAQKADGHPVLPQVSFENATFVGAISFEGVIFEGNAGFARARFEGEARFVDVTFKRRADFQDTAWEGKADFKSATFDQDVHFDGRTVFERDACFDLARFNSDLIMAPTYKGDVRFERARFDAARHLGPLVATRLILDGAVFAQDVTLMFRAETLSAVGAEFRSGANIFAQSATVTLDGAAFGAPSSLTPATHDTFFGALLQDANYEQQTIPSLVSLRGARVADLAISGIDLRACRFRDAHGLESLRLEQVLFDETPTSSRRTKQWPFPITWTRRLAIAEEHRWRAKRQGATGWWPPSATPSAEDAGMA